MRNTALPLILFVSSLLAACGNVSSSNSSAPPPPPPGNATHFSVTVPATAVAGTAFPVTVAALDATNFTASTYSGTIHFTSTDVHGLLPSDLKLSGGTGTADMTLFTVSMQTVTATDTVSTSITGTSTTISVRSPQFNTAGDMTIAREFHTATLLNDGTVLIAGGSDGNTPLASAELFDPAAGNFAPTGSLAAARYHATATRLVNGKVLIVGGFDANGQALASAELYDPAAKTFVSAGATAAPRGLHTATLLKNGNVLVAGGLVSLTGTDTATTEIFDSTSGAFSPTGSMGSARFGHAAVLLNSGNVLVAGGGDFVRGNSSVEIFNPSTGTFAPATAMTSGRAGFTAMLLLNGKVFIAGGDHIEATVNTTTRSTAELFDPTTGLFTSLGEMTAAREGHTATLRGDGTVLIIAGDHVIFTGSTTRVGAFPHTTASTELFDPGTGGFIADESLQVERTNHTATLLKNGKLLIAGGSKYKSFLPQIRPTKTVLSSAELLE